MFLLIALLVAPPGPDPADVHAAEQARVIEPFVAYTKDGHAYAEFAPTVETRNVRCTPAEPGSFECAYNSRVKQFLEREFGTWERRRERFEFKGGCWRLAGRPSTP